MPYHLESGELKILILKLLMSMQKESTGNICLCSKLIYIKKGGSISYLYYTRTLFPSYYKDVKIKLLYLQVWIVYKIVFYTLSFASSSSTYDCAVSAAILPSPVAVTI